MPPNSVHVYAYDEGIKQLFPIVQPGQDMDDGGPAFVPKRYYFDDESDDSVAGYESTNKKLTAMIDDHHGKTFLDNSGYFKSRFQASHPSYVSFDELDIDQAASQHPLDQLLSRKFLHEHRNHPPSTTIQQVRKTKDDWFTSMYLPISLSLY